MAISIPVSPLLAFLKQLPMPDEPIDSPPPDEIGLEKDIRRHGGNIAPDLMQLENFWNEPGPLSLREFNPPFAGLHGGVTASVGGGRPQENLRDYLLSAGVSPVLARQYDRVAVGFPPLQDLGGPLGVYYPGQRPRILLGAKNIDTALHEAIHAYDDLGGISNSREFQLAVRRALEEGIGDHLWQTYTRGDWPHVLTSIVASAKELDQVPYSLRDYVEPLYANQSYFKR